MYNSINVLFFTIDHPFFHCKYSHIFNIKVFATSHHNRAFSKFAYFTIHNGSTIVLRYELLNDGFRRAAGKTGVKLSNIVKIETAHATYLPLQTLTKHIGQELIFPFVQ